ncbi:hypothetical protein [Roseovarius sp.]|uniref:hypothetical protein n=1 Tax=Roseovarius sp. TaxID=1486281 RepID=UPI0025E72A57|nr:hypothetical protein [Roseovarius sp.]
MKLAHFHTFSLAGLIVVAAVATRADPAHGDGARMTYELFEHSIDHVDLAGCPEEFDPDTSFCRLTLADGNAHVFVFDNGADQPMLAVRSYDLSKGLPAF